MGLNPFLMVYIVAMLNADANANANIKCEQTFTYHPPTCTVVVRYNVHVLIRWSLLGSYICFTTTSLDTFDTCLLLRLCWDLRTKLLLLLVESCCSNNCFRACVQTPTVQDLKYVPCGKNHWLSIPEVNWLLDLQWGSWLKCRWQLGTVQKLLIFVYLSAGAPNMTITYVAFDVTKQHPQPQPLSIPCQWHLVAFITDLFKLVHCKNPLLTDADGWCWIR